MGLPQKTTNPHLQGGRMSCCKWHFFHACKASNTPRMSSKIFSEFIGCDKYCAKYYIMYLELYLIYIYIHTYIYTHIYIYIYIYIFIYWMCNDRFGCLTLLASFVWPLMFGDSSNGCGWRYVPVKGQYRNFLKKTHIYVHPFQIHPFIVILHLKLHDFILHTDQPQMCGCPMEKWSPSPSIAGGLLTWWDWIPNSPNFLFFTLWLFDISYGKWINPSRLYIDYIAIENGQLPIPELCWINRGYVYIKKYRYIYYIIIRRFPKVGGSTSHHWFQY